MACFTADLAVELRVVSNFPLLKLAIDGSRDLLSEPCLVEPFDSRFWVLFRLLRREAMSLILASFSTDLLLGTCCRPYAKGDTFLFWISMIVARSMEGRTLTLKVVGSTCVKRGADLDRYILSTSMLAALI